MPIRVRAPDGAFITFPDGTPDSDIAIAMEQHAAPAATKPPPLQRAQTAADKWRDTGRALATGAGGIIGGALALPEAGVAAIPTLGLGGIATEAAGVGLGAGLGGQLYDWATQQSRVAPRTTLAEQGRRAATDVAEGAVSVPAGMVAGKVVEPVVKPLVKTAVTTGRTLKRIADAATTPAAKGSTGVIARMADAVHGPDAAHTEAVRKIAHRLSKGAHATASDILQVAQRNPDKPITLMDVDIPDVQSLAGKVARSPGQGKNIVQNFLAQRAQMQAARLEQDVVRQVQGTSAAETIDTLQNAREQSSLPLYEKARAANPGIRTPVIDEILASPYGKRAHDTAMNLVNTDRAGRGLPPAYNRSLEALDMTKRQIDAKIESELDKSAPNMNEVRILTGLRNRLLEELDANDATEGGYKSAREAWGGPSQSIMAVKVGEQALGNSGQVNAAKVAGMSESDRQFALMGLASKLRQRFLDSAAPNRARWLAQNPFKQESIRPFFISDAEYKAFLESITSENQMLLSGQRITGGSQTAERMVEEGADAFDAVKHGAAALAKGKTGNAIGAAESTMNFLRSFDKIRNPTLAKEMAEIFTAPLSEEGSVANQILRDVVSGRDPVTRLQQGYARLRPTMTTPTRPFNALAAQRNVMQPPPNGQQ